MVSSKRIPKNCRGVYSMVREERMTLSSKRITKNCGGVYIGSAHRITEHCRGVYNNYGQIGEEQ